MKLAAIVKPGGQYEIHLTDGSILMLVGAKASVQLDHADDDQQLLHLAAVVTSGRLKGTKAKTVVPYSAIVKVLVSG